MKKIGLLLLSMVCTLCANAQGIAYLHEDFNGACSGSGEGYPSGWSEYNNTDISGLAWSCTSTNGRWGTGGMQCTNYYDGANHLDTSYLFTPLLNLSGFAGSVFLQYDIKNMTPASKMHILVSHPYTGDNPAAGIITDISVGADDGVSYKTTDTEVWGTYQIDLTAYKDILFNVAFKYTAGDGYTRQMTIDNVLLTDSALLIATAQPHNIPLTVVGNASTSAIDVMCALRSSGTYQLFIFDSYGKVVAKREINAASGAFNCTIRDLNLAPGIYLIKIGHAGEYGIAKMAIN